jgi:Na+/H+ antiporter NhaA
MLKTVHAAAATLAMLLIATFWTSTLVSELFLGTASVVTIKHLIARYGLVCLVILMALTGGTGFAAAKHRTGRLVEEKKRRMPLIGANGVLLMIPAALFLDARASAGQFDTWFYAVQAVELAVGLLQLTLMGKSLRAGLRLSGRFVTTRSADSLNTTRGR